MTAAAKNSGHYRKAGLRYVAFTAPIYCCFFALICLARYIGLTDFSSQVLVVSISHMLIAELLCLVTVWKWPNYGRQHAVNQLWLMVWNNIPFFCYWVYFLNDLQTLIYVIVHTSTVTLFTMASFRAALLYNVVMCPALLATAYLASPNTGFVDAVGTDLIHISAYFVLAVWLSFLAGEFTKQRQKLGSTVSKLNDIREQLIEENQAKSEFLAKMSHEIRTPMNGVLGILQLIEDTELNDKQQQYVATAYNSAQALLAVINDILDFSKIEAGKLSLESIEFDIGQLCEECIAILRVVAEEKNLKLGLDVQANVPRFVTGDPTRLRQIMLNLMGNAIKFTERGGVTLQLIQEREDELGHHLKILITDTGIGIDPAIQEELFSSFHQADSSTSRRYGGTGLGLAISLQLVELMGGEIGVDSEPGQGSCFWLSLPMPRASQQAIQPVSKAPTGHLFGQTLNGVRILVADDNPVNLMVVSGMLKKLGTLYHAFNNAAELIERYRQAPYQVDVILMDCEMPDIDGYEATRLLREFESEQGLPATPIVALTAHVVPEHLQRCYTVGMVDHVIKPLELEKLCQALNHWSNFSAKPVS